MSKPGSKWSLSVCCAVLAATLSINGAAWGQITGGAETPTPSSTPSSSTNSDSQTGTAGVAPDKKMTPEQAKELLASIDMILQFVSKDTKLPIQHEVKRTLISREDVSKHLTKQFEEDKSAKRMQRSEIVLKKFGLLDQDFHLRPFLLSLLTEQIAGYYDNKTKTVNMLDWVAPTEQKPVMAHELTHALQDQKVGLEKWGDITMDSISKNVREDNQHIQTDEASTAREAVAEGQAMAVFLDYSLQGTGHTLANSPDLADKLKDQSSDMSDSPVLARAPLLLQQSLLFPYDAGLRFEDAVLLKAGVEVGFAGVLANPPSSSMEIIHPNIYLDHRPVPVLRMPDIHPLVEAQYAPYDVGVMGELDVRILTELFGGREMAQALSPEWAGGIYWAGQRKSATPAEKETTASLALLYYSQWKNDDSARSFLRVYTGELARKYTKLERRANEEQDGEQIFSTNEGDVLVSMSGRSVFVGEGFDLATSRKLRDAIRGAQGTGAIMTAHLVTGSEPSLKLAQELSGFGMVKAALGKTASSF